MSAYADWRDGAACRHADPDLFFPVADGGPALRQIDEDAPDRLAAVVAEAEAGGVRAAELAALRRRLWQLGEHQAGEDLVIGGLFINGLAPLVSSAFRRSRTEQPPLIVSASSEFAACSRKNRRTVKSPPIRGSVDVDPSPKCLREPQVERHPWYRPSWGRRRDHAEQHRAVQNGRHSRAGSRAGGPDAKERCDLQPNRMAALRNGHPAVCIVRSGPQMVGYRDGTKRCCR